MMDVNSWKFDLSSIFGRRNSSNSSNSGGSSAPPSHRPSQSHSHYGGSSGDDHDQHHSKRLIAPKPWKPTPFEKERLRVLVLYDSPNGKIPLYDDYLHRAHMAPATATPTKTSAAPPASTSTTGGDTEASAPTPQAPSTPSPSPSASPSHLQVPSSTGTKSPNLASKSPLNSPRTARLPRNLKLVGDIELIGEMMFGAVPLIVKGMTTKIHNLRSPSQLLVTKLFSIIPNAFDEMDSSSLPRSRSHTQNSISSLSAAKTPEKSRFPKDEEDELIRKLSHNNSVGKPASPPVDDPLDNDDNKSLPSSPYSNSYTNRRFLRHRSTSMERGQFHPSPLINPPKEEVETSQHQRRLVFSLGVLFDCEENKTLRDFLFSHFALLEYRLHILHSQLASILSKIFAAALNQEGRDVRYVLSLYSLQANEEVNSVVTEFHNTLRLLYSAPRIQEPVWLNMVTFPQRRAYIGKQFIHELSSIVEHIDTKKTNFFFSTLLTSVLTHHLAWVSSVTPPVPVDETQEEKYENAPSLLELQARYFPYNPLWAQLTDLHGSIGTPSTMGKTVIVGHNQALVSAILYILTYFIRCSEVFENVERLDRSPKQSTPLSASTFHSPQHRDDIHKDSGNWSSATNDPDEMADERQDIVDIVALLDSFHSGDGMLRVEPDRQNPRPRPSVDSDEGLPRSRINSAGSETGTAVSPQLGTREAPKLDDSITEEPLYDGFREVQLPKSTTVRVFPTVEKVNPTGDANYRTEQLYSKTYGRSLLSGYVESYVPDVVLHGTSETNFMGTLVEDLRRSVVHNILDEPVQRAVCIIGDTNEFRCEAVVCSLEGNPEIDPKTLAIKEGHKDGLAVSQRQPVASEFIISTLSSVKGLYDLGLPPETCLIHIEDKLQELYYKSILLSEFVNENPEETLTYKSVAKKLGFHITDVPLLVAVASTHHPSIAIRFNISEQLFDSMR